LLEASKNLLLAVVALTFHLPIASIVTVQNLYVHVPFCPTKCDYCAFVTHIGSMKLMEPYLQSLQLEARRWARRTTIGPLSTVYFGGGTPSLMSPAQVQALLERFNELFGIEAGAEITLEAHPSTLSDGILAGFRAAGITRLSFGAESMHKNELRALRREHGPLRAGELVREAAAAGIESVNVDLMYGIPAQTASSWRTTLELISEAGPSHISLYPLQIEARTTFGRRSREGTLSVPNDERVVDMYHDACDALAQAGYEHYEVANWCLPDYECRHNLACWRNQECLGLGVGAHGYLDGHRTENICQTKRYIDAMRCDEPVIEVSTTVTSSIALSEMLMLGLRLLREGVDLAEVSRNYGPDARKRAEIIARVHISGGLMVQEVDRVRLTERAVPVANSVWLDFVNL